ncbi:MAG: MCE family protein, partial [bacterium]|nr:MCE family protein [bacterium]
IIGDLKSVSGKMARGEGTLGALISDPTLFNDMKTLIGKANRNKLLKGVIRWTLQTKDKKLLEN